MGRGGRMIEYRDIKGYEGKYQVSNTGIVIALNFHNQKFKKVLHQDFDKFTDGYKRVSLYLNGKKKRYSVHRLVAEAFIPNTLNKPCVNHKDSNRINNNVDNLEWCTKKENSEHAVKYGIFGKKFSKKVKVVETGIIYPSISECARVLGCCHTNITACLKGKAKSVKGFHFESIG